MSARIAAAVAAVTLVALACVTLSTPESPPSVLVPRPEGAEAAPSGGALPNEANVKLAEEAEHWSQRRVRIELAKVVQVAAPPDRRD